MWTALQPGGQWGGGQALGKVGGRSQESLFWRKLRLTFWKIGANEWEKCVTVARLRPQDVTNVLRRHLPMYHPAGESPILHRILQFSFLLDFFLFLRAFFTIYWESYIIIYMYQQDMIIFLNISYVHLDIYTEWTWDRSVWPLHLFPLQPAVCYCFQSRGSPCHHNCYHHSLHMLEYLHPSEKKKCSK